jgi:hypothetical protein
LRWRDASLTSKAHFGQLILNLRETFSGRSEIQVPPHLQGKVGHLQGLRETTIMQGTTNVSYLPAIVTGAFALGGVLLTLFMNYLERSRDRRMTLRKDVYLQAAEAMAGFQEYLASFADPNIPQEKHKEMLKGVAASINKIHVAGESGHGI